MARPASDFANDVTVYLVLNDYRTGLAYVETALDEADRETVIRNFLSGQYGNALRVIAFNAVEGMSPTRCSIGSTTPTTRFPRPPSSSSIGM